MGAAKVGSIVCRVYSAFGSNPSKAWGVTGVFIGVAGMLLTNMLYFYDNTPNAVMAVQNLIIIGFLVILSCYLFVLYSRKRMIETHLANFSIFIREFNQKVIRDKNRFRFLGDIDSSQFKEKLYDNAKEIFKFTTNELRKHLLAYYSAKEKPLGKDLSIAIRLVCLKETLIDIVCDSNDMVKNFSSDPSAELIVVTCWRDGYTFTELGRSQVTVYDLMHNTPYFALLNERKRFFIANDLRSIGDSYQDQNPERHSHYNTSLVCPIKFDSKHLYHLKKQNKAADVKVDIPHSNILGFVTVDSSNPKMYDLFNDEYVTSLVQFTADELLDMLVAYSKLTKKPSPIVFTTWLAEQLIFTRAAREGCERGALA